MSAKRARRWAGTAAVAAALLSVAGCGGKEVTFTPAADGSNLVQPADGSGAAPTSDSAPAPASPVTVPPNIVVSTQGSSVCVRDRNTGSQACVGNRGTAVVNGVVIVDGKVVATSGASGGGSVIVNGNGTVVGGNVAPAPTSGQVTLGGAVTWRGAAQGTCRRSGDVRHAVVDLANGGRLAINAVGTGVVRIELAAGGDTYSGNWVGSAAFLTLAEKSLSLVAAPVGRGANTVRVSATLDC